MFAFQNISRLFVIERLRIPFDDRKIFSVVVGVAANALLTRAWLQVKGCVQSLLDRNFRGDFAVALEATEGRLARR